jgi:hypothetical protein
MTHARASWLLVLLLAALPCGSLAQTRQPKPPQEPLASLAGTLGRLTGKVLELRMDNDQTLELRCSGKTKYYRDSKRIKAADLKPGDLLVVEVRTEIDESLWAVNVYLQKAAKPD